MHKVRHTSRRNFQITDLLMASIVEAATNHNLMFDVEGLSGIAVNYEIVAERDCTVFSVKAVSH